MVPAGAAEREGFYGHEDPPVRGVRRAGTAVILVLQSGPLSAPEDGLRCHLDAGNYQMAVEAFVWRTYDESLPTDAVEMDIDGHRAAQYWVMKPTDWNNRWWTTCMVAFKTDWGVIQQSLFYSPIYAADDVDCMQTNLQRAHELAPYYRYTKRDASE